MSGRHTEFTVKERRRLVSQHDYGYRPTNDWGGGDLPAPYAEGDMLFLPDGANADRLYGMAPPGYFVVSCAFSIDEGDAWYFRVASGTTGGNRLGNSDRLHVAAAGRCSWDPDQCSDWMSGFTLIDTADPAGLELRQRMLADGWTYKPSEELAAERRVGILQAQLAARIDAGDQLARALEDFGCSPARPDGCRKHNALQAWCDLNSEVKC